MKRLSSITLAFSFVVGILSPAFASESSCPDYPGHKSVLNEGRNALDSAEKPSRGMPYGSFFRNPYLRESAYEIRTVEEYLKEFNELKEKKKKLDGIDLDYFTVNAAYNLFSKQKYKVCREFLEKVFDQLSPKVRNDLYDVLSICYLAEDKESGKKDKSTYLNQLIKMVENKRELTESEKTQYAKAKEYLKKAIDSSVQDRVDKDTERILRLGLLCEILGESTEASKYKSKLIESFKNRSYLDSKELFSTSKRENLISTFENYPNSFSDIKGFPEYVGVFKILVDGSIVLCRRIGNESDLRVMSEVWASELSNLDLQTENHVTMIKSLPEASRKKLLEPKFLIGTSNFEAIYKGLKQRKWDAEAANFEKRFYIQRMLTSEPPGIEVVTRYFFSIGNSEHALSLYDEELERITKLYNGTEGDVDLGVKRIKPLVEDFKKYKVSSNNPIVIQARALSEKIHQRYDKLQCIRLAEELCETGWNLIECGDGKQASKMYLSALDIRLKNLPKDHRLMHIRTVFGRQIASIWPASRIVFGHRIAFNLAGESH